MWHFDWEKLVGFCTSNIDKEMKKTKNWQEFSIAKDPNKKVCSPGKYKQQGVELIAVKVNRNQKKIGVNDMHYGM